MFFWFINSKNCFELILMFYSLWTSPIVKKINYNNYNAIISTPKKKWFLHFILTKGNFVIFNMNWNVGSLFSFMAWIPIIFCYLESYHLNRISDYLILKTWGKNCLKILTYWNGFEISLNLFYHLVYFFNFFILYFFMECKILP